MRINVNPCSETATDLLAAFLADVGYESFVPDNEGLTAYISSNEFEEIRVTEILNDFPLQVNFNLSFEKIEGRDWNEEWEKNYFQPILIGEKCVIHSTFHNNVPTADYDIVIDPKMAFGTGHHYTTSLMIRYLLETDLTNKYIIDMGTGTGILSILAAMRDAKKVLAIEIDEDACANAIENININGIKSVEIKHGNALLLNGNEKADILLANINRNIILNDIANYTSALRYDGTMFLSGFYEHDIQMVREAAENEGMKFIGYKEDNKWVAMMLKKAF